MKDQSTILKLINLSTLCYLETEYKVVRTVVQIQSARLRQQLMAFSIFHATKTSQFRKR